jgi:hypothetical protein
MNKSIIILSLSFFSLSSCSSLYLPNVPNTPMLSSKNELNAAAHIGLKGNTSFNSAYAVSDHLAIMMNGSIVSNARNRKDFSHNLLETGGGYFTTLGADKNRVLEIYGGFGKGNSERIYKQDSGRIIEERQETSFGKTFLQVNYSSKRKKTLNLFGARFPLNYGTALRISHIKMNKFSINDIAQIKEDNVFLEPVFFTRMAISKTVQLQYTSGSNFGLKNRKFLTAGSSVLSVGLVINVGGKNNASTPANSTLP